MKVVVPAREGATDRFTKVSGEDMDRILAMMLDRRMHVLDDPEDVIALDPHRDPFTGRETPEIARYELRLVHMPFSESGIVGVISQREFEAIVAYQLDDGEKRLKQEQGGCEWRLVAAQIERINLRKTVNVDYQGSPNAVQGDPSASLLAGNPQFRGGKDAPVGEPVPLGQRFSHVAVPDYRLQGWLVYCDVARGDLVDPAAQIPYGKPGPMTEYARTRSIRHLTESTRRTRLECVARVRAFYQLGEPAPQRKQAPPLPTPRAPTPTRAAKPGRKKKSATTTPPPAPTVAHPERRPITEELRTTILELRANPDNPMPPGAIAKKLGLELAEVQAVLRGP